MLTIDLSKYTRIIELTAFAAQHRISLEAAIMDLVNKGLSNLDDDGY